MDNGGGVILMESSAKYLKMNKTMTKMIIISVLITTSIDSYAEQWADVLREILQEENIKELDQPKNKSNDSENNTLKTSKKNNTVKTYPLKESYRIYERMAMQFIKKNKKFLQPEVSAASYAYAVKDINSSGSECNEIARINNSIEARSKLQIYSNDMEKYLKERSGYLDNNIYTVKIILQGTNIADYDHNRSALIVENIGNMNFTADAGHGRPQLEYIPCKSLLDLVSKSKIQKLTNQVPKQFKIPVSSFTRDLFGKDSVVSNELQRNLMLYIPMSKEDAMKLLRMDKKQRNLSIYVTFEFVPETPFFELNDPRASGRKLNLPENAKRKLTQYQSGIWSHDINLLQFSYVISKTNEELYRIKIINNNDQVSFFCNLLINDQEIPVTCGTQTSKL